MKKTTDWQEKLTKEQYQVTRLGGTERPGTGHYLKHDASGVYVCVCCGNRLFASDAKFDSGTGWPSFCCPFDKVALTEKRDVSHGMVRTEVKCANCDAHLGHVFEDGPPPGGLRYCINSVALDFVASS